MAGNPRHRPERVASLLRDVLGALVREIRDPRAAGLIVTDVEMPGMGGGALARLLVRDGQRIPVLFMSGYTNDSLLLRGALPENASFLAKPFTQDALRAAVQKALAGGT